jgi:glycosyltransferase involved in cell wall biosynthesis
MLLLLGRGGEAISKSVSFPCISLGHVDDDRFKAIVYSAADVFVHPTRGDNFPLVLQESMACGTPLASFRVGGVPELVRPGVTGYLAEPENASDLAEGIAQLLENNSLRRSMGQQCRTIALQEYGLELQVQRYVDLYRQMLRN